jgi:adenosine deaminase
VVHYHDDPNVLENLITRQMSQFSTTTLYFKGKKISTGAGRVQEDRQVKSLDVVHYHDDPNVLENLITRQMSQFSTTTLYFKGEYITIYLKPWIISTTKEKEVPTLHQD